MHTRWNDIVVAAGIAVSMGLAVLVMPSCAPSAPPESKAPSGPRLASGKPNINGIWQSLGTANWDLQLHGAKPSAVLALGAVGAVPAGLGVVDGAEIPYQDWAIKQREENASNWLTADPEVKCFLPGIPRATYLPFPFQIVQSDERVLFAYEFASASRVVPIAERKADPPIDSWMGDPVARWDGDTLVVDSKGFNDQTWFDRAGNFHSDALQVREKYTLVDANVMNYEATIEDSKVFTRPWTIRMPLYRRMEANAQLMEFKCVEFVEELMYGRFTK